MAEERIMRSKHWGAWLLGGAVAALAGCAQLGDIERDKCGNGIVESGEDCDTFPKAVSDQASTPGKQCGAVGTAEQCRFVCDAAKPNLVCPSGWACGADKICREPSAEFAEAKHPFTQPLLRLWPGDFDGDKQSDVVALAGTDLFAFYFDSADPFGITQSLRPASPPAVGTLTKSDTIVTSDIVMLAQGGINVMRGTQDRAFLPTPYSSMPLGDVSQQAIKLVAINAMAPSSALDLEVYAGDELAMFMGTSVRIPPQMTASQQEVILSGELPGTADNILGEIQVADFWRDPVLSPCQEIALVYAGTQTVHLATPCRKGAQGYEWNVGFAPALQDVTLQAGAILSGVIAADLNGDKKPDLLVDDQSSNLYAAFGTGDGHFHSNPDELNNVGLVADQKFGLLNITVAGEPERLALPLAVADVNFDGIADLVMSGYMGKVLVSVPSAQPGSWSYLTTVFQTANNWYRAAIHDLNGNGIPDIIAIKANTPDFDFFNGVGNGVFNAFTITTEGVPQQFRLGDFDGDLIADVVFSEQLPGGGDNLAVAFGQPFGAPGSPVSIGQLGTVTDILALDMVRFGVDAIKDMLVVTAEKDKDDKIVESIAVFAGSSDRQLQSPLRLNLDKDTDSVVFSVVVGQFDGEDGHPDLAAIGQDGFNSANPVLQSGNRMWLVPVTGDAQIETTKPASSEPLPDGFQIRDGLIAAVNLDSAQGDDELIMLAAYSGPNPEPIPTKFGALGIARATVVGDRKVFVLQGSLQPTRLGWLSAMTGGSYDNMTGNKTEGGNPGEDVPPPVGSEEMIGNAGGQIRVVDVDGDKLMDVIATGLYADMQSAEPTPQRLIAVFRNTGSGTLDVNDAFEIASPSTELIQGFAFMQADTDPELEIVILTRHEAWMVQLDLKGKKLGEKKNLTTVKGGFDALVSDYDGDGIQDLVVVGEGGLFYHAGLAVRK
jgi:hypothetical protein